MKQLNTYILEKLRINKNIKLTPHEEDRIDKIVLDIVKVYFGFIPDLLELEGESFNSDEDKYALIEKMEGYYRDHPEDAEETYNELDIDAIHNRLDRWLDDHNKKRT